MAEQKRIAEILWAADEVVEQYKKSSHSMYCHQSLSVEQLIDSTNGKKRSLIKILEHSPDSGHSAQPAPDETGHYVLSLSALSANGYVSGNLKNAHPTAKMINARLSEGDLLISRSNTTELVGFAGIFDEDRTDVSFPDTMMRLSVNKGLILPEYVEMVILSRRGRKHMMRTASGTSGSMKKINRRTLAEFHFPVPSLAVQSNIMERIAQLKHANKTIVDHSRTSQMLLTRILNDVLGGRDV
jgi:type I restriction enzyme, S subunit